jgi:hypothetical protein
MIARAFILVYRIMKKIVETKNETEWLKNGTPHCHVRRDFHDTDRGVIKMSDVVDALAMRLHLPSVTNMFSYCSYLIDLIAHTTQKCLL